MNYAGMNYDPAQGGRVGPGVSLNPGATAMEGAREAFLTDAELDILPEAVDAGIRGTMKKYGSPSGDTGDLKQIEELPPPPPNPRQAALPDDAPQSAVATNDTPPPRSKPQAALPDSPGAPMGEEDRADRARVEDMPNYNDAEAFATMSGASVEEMGALMRTVDPEGKLPESMRLIKGLTNFYGKLIREGRTEDAQRVASEIMIAAQDASSTYAARAVDAARSGDFKASAEFLKRSYGMIPDGKDFEYEVDESGNGRFVQRDRRGKIISEGPFSAKEIVGAAIGLATPDGFWKQLRTMAGEAGYGGMQPDAAPTQKGKSRAAIPDDGQFRTNRFTGDEVDGPAPQYETIEDQMAAMSPTTMEGLDTPGGLMRERAGTMRRTGLGGEAAAQAQAMRPENEGLDIAAAEINQRLAQAIKAGAASNGEGIGLGYVAGEGDVPGQIATLDEELVKMIDEELSMQPTTQTTEGETVKSGVPGVKLSPEQKEDFITTLDKIARYNKVDPVTLVRPLLGVMFGDGMISARDGQVIFNEDTNPLEVFMDGATFKRLHDMNRRVVEGRQRGAAGDTARMYASTAATPDGGRGYVMEDRTSRARQSDAGRRGPDPYGELNPDALSSIQRGMEAAREWVNQPDPLWGPGGYFRAIPETDKPSDYAPNPPKKPTAWGVERNRYSGGIMEFDLGNGWVDPMKQNVPRERRSMTGMDAGRMAERSVPVSPIEETDSIALQILRKLGIQP